MTQTQDLHHIWGQVLDELETASANPYSCLLYTSDAADE